ncbi:MAG: hypothetical protein L0H96_09350 [Humibacillus sp.]|nr:hypothetical protein [Humibacillus sp.]
MGEKGNDPGQLAAATVTAAIEPSVIERVTTTTTATLIDSSGDVLAKVRDKTVDHTADAVFEGARDRIKRKDPEAETSAVADPAGGADDEQPSS